jgi:PAS domain S-box-containing protein
METTAARTLGDLNPGDHIFCLYESFEELLDILTTYIEEGIRHHQKVICVLGDWSPDEIEARLQAEKPGLEQYFRTGQLSLVDYSVNFTALETPTPDSLTEYLRQQTRQATAEGYTALRVAGEMTWLVRRTGLEWLIEYESTVDDFIVDADYMGLCLYDRRRFDPVFLMEMLKIHPTAAIGRDFVTDYRAEKRRHFDPAQLNGSKILYDGLRSLIGQVSGAGSPGGPIAAGSQNETAWLMKPPTADHREPASNSQPYGDLTELNSCRFLLDSVGKKILAAVVGDFLDLLDTSAAVYEKNGDYALGTCSSGWCRLLDQASRDLCGTADNQEALSSGKWLCYESRWQACRAAIETGRPVDAECCGGLRLHAVPVWAGSEIVGAMNFGYGNPPADPAKIARIALRYGVSPERLAEAAKSYELRPPFIIDYAKRRLETVAQLIGEMAKRRQTETKLEQVLSELRSTNETLVHAQLALAESEEKYKSLGDLIPLGMWIARPDGLNAYISDSYLNLTGLSEEEYRDYGWIRSLHPDDRERTIADWKKCIASGSAWDYTHRVLAADGKYHAVLCRAVPVRDQNGLITCWVGVNLDITDRKRAEDNQAFLARASNQLGTSLQIDKICRTLGDLVVPELADWFTIHLFDKDDQLKRFHSVYPEKATKAQRQAADALWVRGSALRTLAKNALANKSARIYEGLGDILAAAGSDRDTQAIIDKVMSVQTAIVAPLVIHDRVLGVVILTSSSGLCPRRHSEEDRYLVEELAIRTALAVENAHLYQESQAAIAARDEFLSVASHELRTPITSLRGFAQLSLRRYHKEGTLDPERLQRALEVIDAQSDRLAQLISQLLDVSRIDSGKLALDPQVSDIVRLINDVVQTAESRTSGHQIQLSAPDSLFGYLDPLRLEQVLTNLIDNAIKYSPDGGPIEVTSSAEDDGISLSVRDYGIGIPPERRKEIFNRFYQAHKRGQFGGMGLGLYISKQIVELHGGSIYLDFPDGGGTKITVTLPHTKIDNPAVDGGRLS